MTSAGGAVLPEPALLWTPSPDARNTSRVGRYMDWLQRERGLAVADFAALHTWSVTALEDFWQSLWDYFGSSRRRRPPPCSSERTMPGARVVHRRPAQLRRAHRRRALRRRRRRRRRPLADPPSDHADVRRARRRRGPGAGRAAAARRRPGRPRRRLPAQHPRDARRLPRHARASAPRGRRVAPEFGERSVIDRFGQLEPDRAARRRRLPVRRHGHRPVGPRGRDRRRAAVAAPRRRGAVRSDATRRNRRRPAARLVGRARRRRRRPRVRARFPSTTRCACCSRQGPPGCPRRSSTATAGCSSSTSRTTR